MGNGYEALEEMAAAQERQGSHEALVGLALAANQRVLALLWFRHLP